MFWFVRHVKTTPLLMLALVLALTACGGSKKDDDIVDEKKPLPICPQVAIMRELDVMRDYGGEKPEPNQLVSEAKMLGIDGDCAYQNNGIDITFTLHMASARGPRLGGLRADFPFFVAIVDPDQTILNKEKMTAEFHFSSDSRIADNTEALHIFIPLAKDNQATGPRYRVLAGFQITKDHPADEPPPEGKE